MIILSFHGLRMRDEAGIREVSQTLELFPKRELSGDGDMIRRSVGDIVLLRFEVPMHESGAVYRVVVETEDGTSTLYDNPEFGDIDGLTGSGALYMSLAGIESGIYRLTVTNRRADSAASTQVYYFRVEE
jgi:hypothetical protein